MNAAQSDLQQLRIKLILFKSKVRSAVYGGTPDEEFFSSSGPVSQWFRTIGAVRYSHLAEYSAMAKIFKELQTTAAHLIGLYRSGKIEEAHEGLQNIDKLSEQLTRLISALEVRLV
ncbi:CZB domain-containing protein [Rufibacter latericius]|uniref:Histidine kinase n=1 Tax=Rufibacter latericius TaxID=2487040 RepID=A0A3M9MDF9_9BACT|nr:CZB domain-containing protein [Rufibacter latericius]RNI23586.1 histidine kinase [Rufibacter latericius]